MQKYEKQMIQRENRTIGERIPPQRLIVKRCVRGQFLRFMPRGDKVAIWHPQNVDMGNARIGVL